MQLQIIPRGNPTLSHRISRYSQGGHFSESAWSVRSKRKLPVSSSAPSPSATMNTLHTWQTPSQRGGGFHRIRSATHPHPIGARADPGSPGDTNPRDRALALTDHQPATVQQVRTIRLPVLLLD